MREEAVHPLQDRPDAAFDWAERFDEAARAQLADDPSAVLKLMEHPDYAEAVPTPDHFIPLLYLAGLAAAAGEQLEPLVRGYSLGSISMTCYGLGAGTDAAPDAEGAAGLPDHLPPDQTNI